MFFISLPVTLRYFVFVSVIVFPLIFRVSKDESTFTPSIETLI